MFQKLLGNLTYRVIQSHIVQKPHMRSECGKGFSKSCSLKGHILTHSRIKSYICNVCGKGFTHADNLKTHTVTHIAEKKHMCNNKSKYARTLNIHISTHNL